MAEMTKDVILIDTHTNMKKDISLEIRDVNPDNPRVGLEKLGFYPSIRACVKMLWNIGFENVVLINMKKLIPHFFTNLDEIHPAHKNWPFEYHRGLRVTLVGFKNYNLYKSFIQNNKKMIKQSFSCAKSTLIPINIRIIRKLAYLSKLAQYKIFYKNSKL
jgi:hypothetical protein